MRNAVRMISVLTIVGLISGAALVLIYNYADPLIMHNKQSETKNAIFKIFSDAKNYKKENIQDYTVFKVTDKTSKLLGYAFLAEGNGYQGKVEIMAGVKPDLETLTGIEILESQETPGLGQEIASGKFKRQFVNLKTVPVITYVKNQKPTSPNEIEAITGATISSRAVVSILNNTIKEIKAKLK